MKYIITTIIFLLITIAMYHGQKRTEQKECIKWYKMEQSQYVDYYTTDWQKEQCSQFGILLEDRD